MPARSKKSKSVKRVKPVTVTLTQENYELLESWKKVSSNASRSHMVNWIISSFGEMVEDPEKRVPPLLTLLRSTDVRK